jgi:hypothetical protein
VLLDVSELEVHKIHLIVKDLRSYASMLLELVSLVNLKLRLGNARATLVHSLDTVAEHAEILEGPTQTRRRRERGVTR